LIAIAMAANPNNRVLGLVSYAWAGFGAAFGPVVLISVIWKNMTRNGALAGILVGAITVIVWKHFALLGLYEIIPGFIFASLAIYIVSKLGAPTAGMVERFDAAEKDYGDSATVSSPAEHCSHKSVKPYARVCESSACMRQIIRKKRPAIHRMRAFRLTHQTLGARRITC